MTIKQISIFLKNEPGQLSRICRELAEAEINMASLTIADTSDFGIVRMIVEDWKKAGEVLSAKGRLFSITEVVAVGVPDRPGGMSEVLAVLDAAKVNIEYSYAFGVDAERRQAVLVFRFSDNAAACAALAKAGFVTHDASASYLKNS